jgi:agmatinase
METYDIELGCDVSQSSGFWTFDELEPDMSGPKETIARVKEAVTQILAAKKFPIVLGGEHSITLGTVQAMKETYSDLSILQIDAHTDLRNEYEGTKYNHACVMRRIHELGVPHAAVGIRSMSEEEAEYIKKEKLEKSIFYGTKFDVSKIIPLLSKNVFITVDLDGFDPAFVPATGTPEPGGLDWNSGISLLSEIFKKKSVVGFDLVELSPIPGNVSSDFFCAKLAYKMAGMAGKR